MNKLFVLSPFGLLLLTCLVTGLDAQSQRPFGRRHLYFLDFLDPPECSAYSGCFLGYFGTAMSTGTDDECREMCGIFPFILRSLGYRCGTCEGRKNECCSVGTINPKDVSQYKSRTDELKTNFFISRRAQYTPFISCPPSEHNRPSNQRAIFADNSCQNERSDKSSICSIGSTSFQHE